MISRHWSPKELRITVIAVLAIGIVASAYNLFSMPDVQKAVMVHGLIEINNNAIPRRPVLVDEAGVRHECKLSLCLTSAPQTWSGTYGNGLVAKDGTLVELNIDNVRVISIGQFENAARVRQYLLGMFIALEILAISLMIKKRG